MEQGSQAAGLKLSLNQVNGSLRVELPVQRPLEIFTAKGRLIMYVGASGLVQELSLKGFADGEYIVKAGIYEARFVVAGRVWVMD